MISNRWKLILAALPIIGMCAMAQPQPGGLGGFYQAWWGASGLGWTVAQISGALSWWEVDELTGFSNGDGIDFLPDGISGYSLTQTTLADQPTYQTAELNGLPVMRFNGSQYLTNNNAAFNFTSENFSVALVLQVTGEQSGKNRILGNESALIGGWNVVWNLSANTFEFITNQSGTRQISGTSASSLSQWYLVVVVRSGTNAAIYVDGDYDTPTLAAHTDPASTSSPLTIGSYGFGPGAGFDFVGEIAESIIVLSAITSDDREKLEGYLAHKWGREANLPISHPYKDAPP